MSMHIMRKRLGESVYEGIMGIVTNARSELEAKLMRKPSRLIAVRMNERVISSMEWTKKLFALVSPIGMPIWDMAEYRVGYRQRYTAPWRGNASGTNFEDHFSIIPVATAKAQSEQIQSFVQWERKKKFKRLAFIYLGIFWLYESQTETLDQAARRFIEAHPELTEQFEQECEIEGMLGSGNEYAKAIFEDGALVFKGERAIIKSENGQYVSNDPSSTMWAMIATDGYFDWVTEVAFVGKNYDVYS
jgi:hypothetical protein